MGFFDATQKQLAAGRSVYFGELYQLNFVSGPAYYWDGFGPLVAYGDTWQGAANLVQRSEIPFGLNDEAGKLTLTMSGVDPEVVAAVRASESELYGRVIQIWGQFFDEAMQLNGTRFFLFRGTMDTPTYVGQGTDHRTILFPCEGEWADRNGAQFEFFTTRSQQQRYPGPPPDAGLEYIYRYSLATRRTWPQFDPPD
jgi:hypothetical protein